MHIAIPDVFFIPVYYVEEDILNIKKRSTMQKFPSDINFTRKTPKRTELVIGVSFPTQKIDRWVRDKKVMEAYAKDNGVTLKIEINDFDAVKQASQIENLISQGIDALIFMPIDVLAAEELAEKAHKAGAKVICYETLVKNSDVDLFVAFDNIKAGELQGRFLTEKVPSGNYIILSGDPDLGFKEGAMEYIGPLSNSGKIKIVTDKIIKGWEPNLAFNVVKDALITNNNKIDAILAPNDTLAGAAIEALKAQGLAGKVAVTGQNADLDAIRRIIEGTQSMTVFKDTRELAKITINYAIELANKKVISENSYINNGKVDVPSILLTPIVVDRNNLSNILAKSGYLKPNEVYST